MNQNFLIKSNACICVLKWGGFIAMEETLRVREEYCS